jgi:hypothetical protein
VQRNAARAPFRRRQVHGGLRTRVPAAPMRERSTRAVPWGCRCGARHAGQIECAAGALVAFVQECKLALNPEDSRSSRPPDALVGWRAAGTEAGHCRSRTTTRGDPTAGSGCRIEAAVELSLGSAAPSDQLSVILGHATLGRVGTGGSELLRGSLVLGTSAVPGSVQGRGDRRRHARARWRGAHDYLPREAKGPAPSSRASGLSFGCYDFGPLACGGCGFLGLLLPPALLALRSPQATMVPAATPFVSVATCTFTE